MRWFSTFMVAAALIAGAAPGNAQDWEELMERELRARAEELSLDLAGGEFWIGSLGEDDSDARDLDLGPGDVVIAVCDNDCGDIDLYAYDAGGEEVDADVEEGAEPVLEDLGGGSFEIEVYMVSCGAPPCYYALGVFSPL